MKKNTKCTTLIIAALLMLLLTGCGNSGSSGSNATANTGGGTSEDSDTDSALSDSEDTDMEDESENSDTDREEIWNTFNAATINGQTVSYGPITITLPEGYSTEDETSSKPIFYASDSTEVGYTPHIDFVMDLMTVCTSDADANKNGIIDSTKENLAGVEGAGFKELASYEETELGRYKAIQALIKMEYNGLPLVCKSYAVYEKVDSMGKCARVEYYGLESDTGRLSAFEASLESISERTDTSNIKSSVFTPISDWESKFKIGSPLAINGNSVTYGPLQMELSDGYTVEDESAESPVFRASDGSLFQLLFGEDSYQLTSDKEQMEDGFKERLGSQGMTDISVGYYETISIDGYDGYAIRIDYMDNGTKMVMASYMIFETTDETRTPVISVVWVGSEEVALNYSAGEAVFQSIRLVSE